jgi:hypothetical protein
VKREQATALHPPRDRAVRQATPVQLVEIDDRPLRRCEARDASVDFLELSWRNSTLAHRRTIAPTPVTEQDAFDTTSWRKRADFAHPAASVDFLALYARNSTLAGRAA